jgi:hypothetical protein
MLLQLYRESTAAQVGRAQAMASRACDLIRDRYTSTQPVCTARSPKSSDEGLRRDMTAAVSLALSREDGVEGGIWRAGIGSLAYAFPICQGSGPKTDLPAAEQDRIRAVNEQTVREEQPVDNEAALRSQTLVLHGCPLAGPMPGLTAWTMMRVQAAPGYDRLRLGFGFLLALVVVMSAWLARVLVVWTRHVRAIETALGRNNPEAMRTVERTGERELDRIIDALNVAGRRLAAARRHTPRRWLPKSPPRNVSSQSAASPAALLTKSAIRLPRCGCAQRTRSPATMRVAAKRLRTSWVSSPVSTGSSPNCSR